MENQFNRIITNQFNSRGFELFINQNTDNQWLSADDVAGWIFETNAPDDRQLSFAINFLNSASKETLLGPNPAGVLEKEIQTLRYKCGNRICQRTKPVYRLADASMINTDYVPESLEVSLDRAAVERAVPVKESWQTELDSLPF